MAVSQVSDAAQPPRALTLLKRGEQPPKTIYDALAIERANQPLPPRAETLTRGVHAMPFGTEDEPDIILLVAITSKGARVHEETVTTPGEQESAIELMESILNIVDPPQRKPIAVVG